MNGTYDLQSEAQELCSLITANMWEVCATRLARFKAVCGESAIYALVTAANELLREVGAASQLWVSEHVEQMSRPATVEAWCSSGLFGNGWPSRRTVVSFE